MKQSRIRIPYHELPALSSVQCYRIKKLQRSRISKKDVNVVLCGTSRDISRFDVSQRAMDLRHAICYVCKLILKAETEYDIFRIVGPFYKSLSRGKLMVYYEIYANKKIPIKKRT